MTNGSEELGGASVNNIYSLIADSEMNDAGRFAAMEVLAIEARIAYADGDQVLIEGPRKGRKQMESLTDEQNELLEVRAGLYSGCSVVVLGADKHKVDASVVGGRLSVREHRATGLRMFEFDRVPETGQWEVRA